MWIDQLAVQIAQDGQEMYQHIVTPKITLTEPTSYAEKRKAALEYLGNKWLLHSTNAVKKLENVSPILTHKKTK